MTADHDLPPLPRHGEAASSDEAKFLLDTMDDMMFDLFPREQVAIYYAEENGGWDIAEDEIPLWVRSRLSASTLHTATNWSIETFRNLGDDGRLAAVDDPADGADALVARIVFLPQATNESICVTVHGAFLPDDERLHYWLSIEHLSRAAYSANERDQLPSLLTLEVEKALDHFQFNEDTLRGANAVTSEQALELEQLLQRVWVRSPYEGP